MDIAITNIKFNRHKLYADDCLVEDLIQSIDVKFNINQTIESEINIKTNIELGLNEIKAYIMLELYKNDR